MIPGLRSGTGKSLAYILPILASIDNYSPTLQAVIVAPTGAVRADYTLRRPGQRGRQEGS